MSSSVAAPSAALDVASRHARRAHRNKSRALAWAEIAALVLITAALIAATVLGSARVHASLPSEVVRVENGQTLWELATRHPIAGLTTEQTADVIARLNHLEGGRLAAGVAIRIPVEAGSEVLVACR